MQLPIILLLLSTVITKISCWESTSREQGAINARTLVNRENLANLNTDHGDLPVSFVEYYADCDEDGDPIFLMIDMSSSMRNIKNGSNYSISIRVGDHGPNDEVDPHYPGGRPGSVSGSPRVNLRGEFVEIEHDERLLSYEKCFVKKHKDSVMWLPGNPIHSSRFMKFIVSEVYFVGGFGDIAFIGEIDQELYHQSKIIKSGAKSGLSYFDYLRLNTLLNA